jgi:DNA-binding transcriptional LysR family regulator
MPLRQLFFKCILVILNMRITQLRQADLNLLVVFTAIAEERSVSRAATRLLLSQPALSRALQRLREMFKDDLLIRTPAGYEPTARGERLLQELSEMLPRIDRLLSGATFDPTREAASFRVAATDNASQVMCPRFCRKVLPYADRISCQFVPVHDGTFEAVERGRLDLALNADDSYTPDTFHREVIYEDTFVCVVAKKRRLPKRFTLKQYLAGIHVGVGVLGSRQTIVEQRLATLGSQRRCVFEVPHFTAALRCVPGTELIATLPARLAELERHDAGIAFVDPPVELRGFRYLMIWHPRLHTDAAHVWLRSMMSATGRELNEVRPAAPRA